jgi:hypothetical protein
MDRDLWSCVIKQTGTELRLPMSHQHVNIVLVVLSDLNGGGRRS